jgi:DNA-binding response OmpR family regulator
MRRAPIRHRDPLETKVFEVGENLGALERKLILLLEDDGDLASILKELLEENSYRVIRAKDGVEGLRQVMASDFDAIICDLMMPSLPGDMFFLAVQRARPHLCKRFIFMTGHRADPKYDNFARSVGAAILWKPFQMQDLLDAVQAVLKKASSGKA